MRRGRRVDILSGGTLRWLIILLVPVVLGLLTIAKNFPGLGDPDALDMAQIARSLARTGHYTTQSIRPLSLLYKATIQNHPDLYQEPLQPVIMSIVFRLWNAADKPVAVLGALLWMGTFWLTLGFAKRLFSWRVAALAALLFATNSAVLGVAVSGTNVMLSTFLFSLLLWTLYRPVQDPNGAGEAAPPGLPLWRLVVAGAIAGLCVLTMYSLVALVIPVLVYALYDQRRLHWWRGGVVLVGIVAVLLPWLVRNQVVTGSPLFTLRLYEVARGTASYPGEAIYRSMDPKDARDALPLAFGWQHLGEVRDKAKGTILGLQDAVPGAAGALVAAFFLAGMFFPLGDRGFVRVRRCFYGVFLAHITILALTRSRGQDMILYMPFASICAAATLARLIGSIDLQSLSRAWQAREWRLGATALGRLAVLSAIALGIVYPFGIWLRRGSIASAQAAAPKLEWLKPIDANPPLVMSDMPQAVAWYCDRPVVWLTQTSRGYDRLVAKVAPIGIIHFLAPPGQSPWTAGQPQDWWVLAYSSPAPYKGLVNQGSWSGRTAEIVRALPSIKPPKPPAPTGGAGT
jgi:4-amino-4-deoxy-L-arabinose transferase-like glycosyltransferase